LKVEFLASIKSNKEDDYLTLPTDRQSDEM